MVEHSQFYFHRKVFTSKGAILHIAALVLKFEAGYDLDMLGGKASIDNA